MLTSLNPSDAWNLASKDRLKAAVARPLNCRVAPSPTGHFHVGTLRTALHNYLLAKASGGQFLLRVDDTDQSRNHDDFTQLIFDSLSACGLNHDRIFYQSARKNDHGKASQHLLSQGYAIQDGTAIRLNVDKILNIPTSFFDLSGGVTAIPQAFLDQSKGLVLVRSDGNPTYHFASIVDDIDADINLILRGADHVANTTKQLLIALALAQSGYPKAQKFVDQVLFAHVGLITLKGKKLSKRDQQSDLSLYLKDGFPHQSLLQYVMPLGWGHPDSTFDKQYPIVDLKDMPSLFVQGGLRISNCSLDDNKLQSLKKKWVHLLK